MTSGESEMRATMVRVARMAGQRGLVCSSDGNLSVRLDGDRFLVTPSGHYKAAMDPADLLIVDAEGTILSGREGIQPTSELYLHREVYRQRPDVNAVLHGHPPHATALTLLDLPLPENLLPEVLIALGGVPTAPYATPGTPELAATVRELVRHHDTILLSHHGSLCVGQTLDDTLISLERLELAAQTYFIARMLGPVVPLPPDELDRLRAIGARLRGC